MHDPDSTPLPDRAARPPLKLKRILLLGLLAPHLLLSAQNSLPDHAAYWGGTGATAVGLPAHQGNPAGTAYSEHRFLALAHQNKYGLPELSSRDLYFLLPSSLLVLSGGFQHSGQRPLQGETYSLAAARTLAPWLRMGLRGNYWVQRQQEKEARTAFILDAGVQYQPLRDLSLGFFTCNPLQKNWSDKDPYHALPSYTAAALNYRVVEGLELEVGVLKEADFDASFHGVLQVELHPQLALRGALSGTPLRLSLGTQLQVQAFYIHLQLQHHQVLGWSSVVGLAWRLPHKPQQTTSS